MKKKTMAMEAEVRSPNGAKMRQWINPQYHDLRPGTKVIFAGGGGTWTVLATAALVPMTRDMLCWTVAEVVK